MLKQLFQAFCKSASKTVLFPTANLCSVASSPVNSYTEWDPLEEVLVGRPEGSVFSGPWAPPMAGCAPKSAHEFLKAQAGNKYPEKLIKDASKEVEEFCRILEIEGVKVVRPEIYDASKPFETPTFRVENGYQNSVPRDIFIVMGDTILETPPAWRNRFFDYVPYRKLLKSYFDRGAKWIAAPKPLHNDSLYINDEKSVVEDGVCSLTEEEIVFDAAVFQRCGKDIFMRKSHVANESGLNWVQRHFPEFNFHLLDFGQIGMHIDTCFTPLAPGKLLVSPSKPCLTGELRYDFTRSDGVKGEFRLPDMFKGWDVFVAVFPPPNQGLDTFYQCGTDILSANVLSLDEKRVVCPASEPKIVKQFQDWGFTPIPVHFNNAMYFGGGFHCHTVDIRRKGGMQSYFQ